MPNLFVFHFHTLLVAADELDRHLAFQAVIEGLVDRRHAALTRPAPNVCLRHRRLPALQGIHLAPG